MLEILDSELSRSQSAELLNFMVNNPYAKAVDLIDIVKKSR